MVDVDKAWNMATTLLSGAEAALTTYGLTVPTRKYVGFEAPSFDCELLSVSIGPLHIGDTPGPGPERVHPQRVLRRTFNMGVWIVVDCWPVGDIQAPTPAEIQAATQEITRYGWALFEGLISQQVNKQLFSSCPYVEIGPAQPIAPSGAMTAWSMPVAAQI